MILIADSGSTKTDWCVVGQGQLVRQIVTKGMNPFVTICRTRDSNERNESFLSIRGRNRE